MKKQYIKPTATLVVVRSESLLSGSDPQPNPDKLSFDIPTDGSLEEEDGFAD